jgi:hypothetical protein
MSDVIRPTEILAFICRSTTKGKLRAKFFNTIPSIGSHISIGKESFVVKEVVHPLNLWGDVFCGDRAVEIFVDRAHGTHSAEDYTEVTPTELAKSNSLFS